VSQLTLRFVIILMCSLMPTVAYAQRNIWRQATETELKAELPARAPVEKEHIETEMTTASGITDGKGNFIAGVVLITAGYSADGKYSHYLLVQVPMRIGGVALESGEYVLGWTRKEDSLNVHIHKASTGALVGTAEAHRIQGSTRVESLHIWPPNVHPLLQIGRFGVPYEIEER